MTLASAQDRLSRAREALLRAEEQAGVRSARERAVAGPGPFADRAPAADGTSTAPLGSTDTTVGPLPLRGAASPTAPAFVTSRGVGLGVVVGGLSSDEGDPLAPRVAGVGAAAGMVGRGPAGASPGVGVGRVLEVSPGTGALLRAAARVVPAQGWIGFVGVHDIGWVAAGEAGIDLSRVLSVPDPGPLAADVVATLLDGVDVLCMEEADLSLPQQRRLAARIRRDGRIILTSRAWPGISRPHRRLGIPAREEAV